MNFESVKNRLKEYEIDLPEYSYSEKELEEILSIASSLPIYPRRPIILSSLYDSPIHFQSESSDPRLLNYEFRKLILGSKKIGALSSYSNSLLSVNKLNVVLDLD